MNYEPYERYALMKCCGVHITLFCYNENMQLFKLEKCHIGRAAEALADSFLEDGLVCRLCPDGALRKRAILPLFRFTAGLAVHGGEAWATSPALEGVALWMLSSKMGYSPWRWLALGGADIRRGLGREATRELSAVSDRIDRARDSVAPERYLYLACLGVRPAHRRRGLATALVADRARRSSAAGLPVIVETNTPEALAFYRSTGFAVLKSFRAADMDYYVLEYP